LEKCASDGTCPLDIALCGALKKSAVKVFRCDTMAGWPLGQAPDACLNAKIEAPIAETSWLSEVDKPDTYAVLTPDHRTLIINPYGDSQTEHLGSSKEPVSYIVHLSGGTNGLKKEDEAGVSVFNTVDGYKWRFTTGTFVDLTPPKVLSVIPINKAGIDPSVEDVSLDEGNPALVYRNQIVVVNFDEPVLPPLTTTQNCKSADLLNEAQLTVAENLSGCSNRLIPGIWSAGFNKYQTIQYLASLSCGNTRINSCGNLAYCFPASVIVSGLLKAADISTGIAMIGTGIMDIAGNSLDGNSDEKADGQPADNYAWSFAVGNTIDLVPPKISSVSPLNASENIDKNVPIVIAFNKAMEPASTNEEIYLYGQNFDNWFDPDLEIKMPYQRVVMTHGPFVEPVQVEGSSVEGTLYQSVVRSAVRDIRQNCFTPSVPVSENSVSLTGGYCSGSTIYGKSCCPAESDPNFPFVLKLQNAVEPNVENNCFIENITR